MEGGTTGALHQAVLCGWDLLHVMFLMLRPVVPSIWAGCGVASAGAPQHARLDAAAWPICWRAASMPWVGLTLHVQAAAGDTSL